MINKPATIRHVMHEQAPKQIPDHNWRLSRPILARLNRPQKIPQTRPRRRIPVVVAVPRKLADEIRLVRGSREGDVLREFCQVARVEVVGHDVDAGDGEVGRVEAVGAVDDEFVRGEGFDVAGYFGAPGGGHVLVAEDGAAELVAGFVGEDCGVFGVGEVCVGVEVREEVMDVGFEVGDYGGVGVELLDQRGDRRGGGGDVDAAEAEEGEFAAVVVVLFCWFVVNWKGFGEKAFADVRSCRLGEQRS